MFFTQSRYQFFRPLTSKYRQQVVECLCLLYQRLYGANADYGASLRREQVIEIFEEALIRVKDIGETDRSHLYNEVAAVNASQNIPSQNIPVDQGFIDEESEQRFKSEKELATWILNLLIEHGWIDKQVDPATLQSNYPFSRVGRLFTYPLVEADTARVRTRHRNTRNTLNALGAYSRNKDAHEVHDLLDAYEYSERIITDFTDVISELEERKRELVKEVESHVLVREATDQFFDFMEKRFRPDLSVRLSADSVEKHHEKIVRVVQKIRRRKADKKRQAELALRAMAPELVCGEKSVLWHILDTIEMRMRIATDTMLPALRKALQSFTKRADIIIRQLSYMHYQHHNDLVSICKRLSEQAPDIIEQRLANAGEHMAGFNLRLVDPAQNKLHQRKEPRVVHTAIAQVSQLNAEAHKALLIQQMLDQAFMINDTTVKKYVLEALRSGRRLSTKELSVDKADDLLAMAHVIEVGAVNNSSSEYRFKVTPVGETASNDYYRRFDQFYIELESITDSSSK